ncbi:hypothetical protein BLA27_09700 [Brucella cytisi]|uniref:Uncharacterized protein n=1 Tax=Brucella cytisi TaxID=407152 RepID=A0A1J6IES3_9HYPH|nr:hypothetical protein BLA27_09700 [Brucella cytisi]
MWADFGRLVGWRPTAMAVAIFIKSSDASARISSREFKHPHLLLGGGATKDLFDRRRMITPPI